MNNAPTTPVTDYPHDHYMPGDLHALSIEDNPVLATLSAPAYALYAQLAIRASINGGIAEFSAEYPYPFENADTLQELIDAELIATSHFVDAPHALAAYWVIDNPATESRIAPEHIATITEHLDDLTSVYPVSVEAQLLYVRLLSRASGYWVDYYYGHTPELDHKSAALTELLGFGLLEVGAGEIPLSEEQSAGEEPVRYELPAWVAWHQTIRESVDDIE